MSCARPTIRIPDQYIRKQEGVYLSGFQKGQVVQCSNGPFGFQPLLDHSNTELVKYSGNLNSGLVWFSNGLNSPDN